MTLPGFYRLLRHDRIASTSDEAKSLAAAGAAEGTLVWAREQTKGRGRQGRDWVSPVGNLYASLILRPNVSPPVAAQLSFVAALAMADACLDLAPEAAIALKWPNDVMLSSHRHPRESGGPGGGRIPAYAGMTKENPGRKVAGILLESQSDAAGGLSWLVIGIGINLATYPMHTETPATALAATGADVAPAAMLGAFAARFLGWRERWREGAGFAPIRAAWLARAQGLGGPIRVRLPGEELAGIFAGLDEDGALLLEQGVARRRIAAGEVFSAAS